MAGDPSLQVTWHLSGGAGNTDADASLGGAIATQQIASNATTVSANGSAGDVRVYLASVAAAAQANGRLYFRDGNAGGWSSEVIEADAGSNWVQLLDPLPASIAIGDSVWFFRRDVDEMPFKNVTALESSQGFTHYCGIYATNSGGGLSNCRFYLERLDPGPVLHELAASNDLGYALPTIATESTAPDLSSMLVGAGQGRFVAARTYADGSPDFTFAGGSIGMWIKRTLASDAVRNAEDAIAVVCETASGFQSKCVLTWDTAGFTPTIAISHAPSIYLRGGGRFKAVVRSQETGLVVSGVPVGFSLTAGPGTLEQPPDPGQTNDEGVVWASYAAPVDVGEIGNTFTVEAQV